MTHLSRVAPRPAGPQPRDGLRRARHEGYLAGARIPPHAPARCPRAMVQDCGVAYATAARTGRPDIPTRGDLCMIDPIQASVTRRRFLRSGALAAAAAPLLARAPLAAAQSPARGATKVLDFHTLADVAKAE